MNDYSISKDLKGNLLKVELNEQGDFIYLNPNDTSFMEKFSKFLRWMDEKGNDLQKQGNEAEEKFKGRPLMSEDEEGNTMIDTEQFELLTQIQAETMRECSEKIDQLFGQNTLGKYFKTFYEINPDFVPDEECVEDFLSAITPAIEKVYQARVERISKKYTRKRTGRK